MSVLEQGENIEQRLERLERRLATTIRVVSANETRLDVLEGVRGRTRATTPRPSPATVSQPVEHLSQVPTTAPRDTKRPAQGATSLGDFLGGRALAWLGGIATLLGIVLLLGLAISHDWIGPAVRVILAGAGSAALLAGGAWLHAHRGRTEAAVAMVGAATAGAFATLVVAGDLYRLIPAAAAVVAAMLVGAVATALAIRWAGRAIAVLGLVGALLSPVLVGAPHGYLPIVLLAVAAACSMSVVLWRRWPWLALATVLVCAPQWAWWMAGGAAPLAELAVLVMFGSIGLAGAVFTQVRGSAEKHALHLALALVLLNATIVGVAGRLAFGTTGGALWLTGIAIAHATLGLWRRPRIAVHPTLRRLLIAIAVVLADVALGIAVHGIALTAAWGATAIGYDRSHARRAGAGRRVGVRVGRAGRDRPPHA